MKTLCLLFLAAAIGASAAPVDGTHVRDLNTATTVQPTDKLIINTNVGGAQRTVTISASNFLQSVQSFANWPLGSGGSATNAQPPSTTLTNLSGTGAITNLNSGQFDVTSKIGTLKSAAPNTNAHVSAWFTDAAGGVAATNRVPYWTNQGGFGGANRYKLVDPQTGYGLVMIRNDTPPSDIFYFNPDVGWGSYSFLLPSPDVKPGTATLINWNDQFITYFQPRGIGMGMNGRPGILISNSVDETITRWGYKDGTNIFRGDTNLITGRGLLVDSAFFAKSNATIAGNLTLSGSAAIAGGALLAGGLSVEAGDISVLEGFIELPELAVPTTPASGFGRVYPKADGKLYFLNDGGTETDLTLGASGGEANVNGEIHITNSTRFGWVYGKQGVTNLLRSFEPLELLSGINTAGGSNIQLRINSQNLTNLAGTGAITNANSGAFVVSGGVLYHKDGALLTNQSVRGLTLPDLTASRPLVLNGSGVAVAATGTPDGTKFLRDDGTLAVPTAAAVAILNSNLVLAPTLQGSAPGQLWLYGNNADTLTNGLYSATVSYVGLTNFYVTNLLIGQTITLDVFCGIGSTVGFPQFVDADYRDGVIVSPGSNVWTEVKIRRLAATTTNVTVTTKGLNFAAAGGLALHTNNPTATMTVSNSVYSAAVDSTELGYLDGVTSAIQTQIDGKQTLDSDLTAVAGLSANGIVTRTGTGTMSARTVTGTSLDITVSNGDGVSGNPTLTLDRTATLAGNPALAASTMAFATTGLIAEGSTADTIETLLTFTDPTSTDKTITFPNASGTVAVSASGAVSLSAAGDITATRVGVYRTIYVDAAAMVSNITSGATFSTIETSSPTNRMVDSYVFSGTVTNIVQFKVAMPEVWDLSTIKVKLWTQGTNNIATTTNVWAVSASAIKTTSVITNIDWGTELEITNVVSSAGGQALLTPATPALTIGNTPTANSLVWFRIRRLPGDADDNDGGEQKILGAWIQYKEGTTEPAIW